jgi:hypothetical protein
MSNSNFRIANDLFYYAFTAFLKAAQFGVIPSVENSIQQAINKGAKRVIIAEDVTEPATIVLKSDLLVEINAGATLTFASNTQIDLNGYTLTLVGMGGCSTSRGSVIAFSQTTTSLFTSTVANAYLICRDLVINQNSPSGGANNRGLVDATVPLEIQSTCVYINNAQAGDTGYVVSGGTTALTNISITDVSFNYSVVGVGAIVTGGNCTNVSFNDITFEGQRPAVFCDVYSGLFCDDMTDSCTGGTNIQLQGNNIYENCGNHGGTAFEVLCDGPATSSGNIEIANCNLSQFSCTSAVATNIQIDQTQFSGDCSLFNTLNQNCTAEVSDVQVGGDLGIANSSGTNNIKCTNIKVSGTCSGATSTGIDTVQMCNVEISGATTFGGDDSEGSTKVICTNLKCGGSFNLDAGCDSAQVNNLTCAGTVTVTDSSSVAMNNCQITGSNNLVINATGAGECSDFKAVGCQIGGFVDGNATGAQTGLKLDSCQIGGASGGDAINLVANYTNFSITGCLASAGNIDCVGVDGLLSSCQSSGSIDANAASAVVGCKATAVNGSTHVAGNY